jgi:hypothetical protein
MTAATEHTGPTEQRAEAGRGVLIMATQKIIRPTPTPPSQKVGIASGRWPNRNEQTAAATATLKGK